MKNQYFKTKDQFIASTLYSLGEKIISTKRNKNECFFIFENSEKCQKIINEYFNDELSLSPKKLFNSFKDIKTIIFSNN